MSISDLKNKLSDLAFKVTQEGRTEPPFSGEYNNLYSNGKYVCVCCGTPLFSSKNKFNSKSGWPSFYQPINEDCLKYIEDDSYLEEAFGSEVPIIGCPSSYFFFVFKSSVY